MTWIKVECDLGDKPEVHYIASLTQLDHDAVIGKLFRVWSWFDRQTTDGNAHNVTLALLDRLTGHQGFGEAMQFAGWIEQRGKDLIMVNFDRHNGESAKKRALTAQRQSRYRNANSNAPVTLTASPEKRREDIKEEATSKAVDKSKTNGHKNPCQHHNDDGSVCGDNGVHKLHPASKDWFCRNHLNG